MASEVPPPIAAGVGPRRQGAIYSGMLTGERPRVPIRPRELEAAAERAMDPRAHGYLCSAGMHRTADANRAALDAIRIVPRMCRDVSRRDLTTTLFGRTLPVPMLLAPIGVQDLANPEGDLATARGAASRGVPMIFSNQASVTMETCAASMGDSPRWFQLYWGKNDDLARSLVQRAEACGAEAIVVTLDTTMLGWRPVDLDNAFLPFITG